VLHFPLLIIPSSNTAAVFVGGLATIYKNLLCPYQQRKKTANGRQKPVVKQQYPTKKVPAPIHNPSFHGLE
jgi:hypothetical protein